MAMRNPKTRTMNPIDWFLIAGLLAAITAPAQEWAKTRLENSPRHLEWVKVKHHAREVNCFLAFPEVKGKATAVVVIHEIFGLTDWVRGVADQLAQAGKTYEPVIYDGAGHGFMRAGEAPDTGEANRKARETAWQRWKAFLGKI
jgi:dienelactone hydrolase